jgi:hypothetical protein
VHDFTENSEKGGEARVQLSKRCIIFFWNGNFFRLSGKYIAMSGNVLDYLLELSWQVI